MEEAKKLEKPKYIEKVKFATSIWKDVDQLLETNVAKVLWIRVCAKKLFILHNIDIVRISMGNVGWLVGWLVLWLDNLTYEFC